MAKEIRPLQRYNEDTEQTEIFYPATTTDAIADVDREQSLTETLEATAFAGEVVGDPTGDWNKGDAEDYIDKEIAKVKNWVSNTPVTNVVTVTSLPASGNVNTLYRVAGTNTYSEYGWDGTQFVKLDEKEYGIDDEPTAESDNLVKSGGVSEELALGAVYNVSAKNPTAGPNNNGTWESFSALLSDPNLNSTLIPTSIRKGGMSVKFVNTDGKYEQWRYMDTSTSNTSFVHVDNWQGVVESPVKGSKNLITSGSVYTIKKKLDDISINQAVSLEQNYRIITSGTTVDVNSKEAAAHFACGVVSCHEGDKFSIFGIGGVTACLYCFIDSSGNKLEYLQSSQTPIVITAPANTDKVVFNVITLYDYFIYTNALDYLEIQKLSVELEGSIDYSKIILLENYCIKTKVATVNVTPVENNGINCAVVNCSAGDKFTIFGKGDSNYALYCFIDSSGNRLELKRKTEYPIIITAPTNASKVVFNAVTGLGADNYFYKGIKPDVYIDNVNKQLNITTPNEPVKLTHGYRILTNSTTVGSPEFYDGFACAAINCSPGDKFTVWGSGGSTTHLYCFVDSSNNKLDSKKTVANPTVIIAPANSAKVVFNIIDLNDVDYGIYKGEFDYISIEELSNYLKVQKWWKDKIVYTFGDSITWYDGREFSPGHSEAGQIAVGYQSYLRQLGCTVTNYGKSGYTMPQILEVIKGQSYLSCDCVTITCGANDFRVSAVEPLGEIAPIGSAFDETTMIGALQAAIEWLIGTKPSLRIFIMTPIKGFTYNEGVWATMPEEYAQAFLDVGKLYSLPVCDWYHDSGINFLNKTTFIGDPYETTHYMLHPTNAGFALMGRTITGFFSIR